MFCSLRFKLPIVVVLALLLTVALAPAAAAATPPPAIGPGGGGGGGTTDTGTPNLPDTGDGNGNGNGNGVTIPPDLGNGNGNGNGNGDPNAPDTGNGDKDDMDDMMEMSAPVNWPPPNAIVRHAATPIQISSLGGGLQVYLISPDGSVVNGPLLDPLSDMAEMHPSGDAVQLYEGVNPGSGKPVTIEYLPAEMKLRVRTFYADKPPHDFDKAYIFTVDADHSVTHERW